MAKSDIIPDGEILYRYASPESFPEDQFIIPDFIFNNQELSCDWEKYQSNPNTSDHVIRHGRTIIIKIKVCDEIRNPRNPKRTGEIVNDWKQEIIHDPSKNNISHSLIKGKKKKAVRDAIVKNSSIY